MSKIDYYADITVAINHTVPVRLQIVRPVTKDQWVRIENILAENKTSLVDILNQHKEAYLSYE